MTKKIYEHSDFLKEMKKKKQEFKSEIHCISPLNLALTINYSNTTSLLLLYNNKCLSHKGMSINDVLF